MSSLARPSPELPYVEPAMVGALEPLPPDSKKPSDALTRQGSHHEGPKESYAAYINALS